jgi:hypothetical protein
MWKTRRGVFAKFANSKYNILRFEKTEGETYTCRMILGSDGRAKPFLSPSSCDNLSLILLIGLIKLLFSQLLTGGR